MSLRKALALLLALSPLAGPSVARAEPPEAAIKAHDDGLRYAKENLLTEAVEALEKAVKLDPGWADAWADLGNTQIARGSLPDAIKAFESAVRIRPEFQIARYNLAYALRKTGRHERAAEQYRLYLQRDPEDADASYGLAESLKATGDKAAAAEAYEQYAKIEKRPGQEKWIEKARAEARSLRSAIEATKPAEPAKKEPAPAVATTAEPTKAARAGSTTQLGLTQVPPTNARATTLTKEQLAEAKATEERAKTPRVERPEAQAAAAVGPHPKRFAGGLEALKKGDYAKAHVELADAAKEAPEDSIVLAALGSAALGLERGEEAEATYRRALTTAKDAAVPALYFGLGEALRLQNEPKKARESYERATKHPAASPELKKLIEERTQAL